ncbi:hypothetical protein [Metapseudomonas otitidis]|uniref:hypothetical protein n=1 Tax=Metapseudomonas otitidis TaxID=319939 RepID=UPI001F473CB7|nr:hypothetical protein [Pseudomonas otitidis]
MDRKVYGDLSKVALRAMHEAAVKFEVTLKALPVEAAFQLPDDLVPIAEKLLDYARGASNRLTHEEERHLMGAISTPPPTGCPLPVCCSTSRPINGWPTTNDLKRVTRNDITSTDRTPTAAAERLCEWRP